MPNLIFFRGIHDTAMIEVIYRDAILAGNGPDVLKRIHVGASWAPHLDSVQYSVNFNLKRFERIAKTKWSNKIELNLQGSIKQPC